ncbi:peptidase [Porphyrobacter sp. SLTP]|uniref:M67 family metallopeptidase n=1 Tax=Porphyrobacter sp. SLTP TaxID=2683266 RepID=UPI001412AD8F|nr:M67 family metallopeptidase [Porphyrobacter sp. SLTP]NBB24348.1 peptidase [Porphyrobacter sp. SLTP]
MQVEVTSQALATMRAAAAAAHPLEACGLLLGEGTRITEARETRNVHPAPQTHFEIDPQALIDAHRAARGGTGPRVLGYFHSHPAGPPAPSATDRASASGDGRVWAIIAGRDVKFWMDGEQGFVALPFAMIDG